MLQFENISAFETVESSPSISKSFSDSLEESLMVSTRK